MPFEATAGCALKSALLSLLTLKVTVWPLSSAGPAEIAVAQLATLCAPASSLTVWSAPLVKLGASLTATTVMVKVCGAEVSTPPFAVPPSSCAVTVTVAVPFALAGSAIAAEEHPSYDEVVAEASPWVFHQGHELMRRFLGTAAS